MDERTSEVVKEIARQRQRLGDDIAQLEQKVRSATTWQTYFVRNPWLVLGLALGGGLMLSGLIFRRSESKS